MNASEVDLIRGKILSFLRANPKGSTVTEVSKEIGLNRNSTAKYLDILRVNGRIDMRPLGRAKVFYISQRVPISALLDFSTEYILILDGSMRIVEVNENFQKFFHIKKEMLLDVPLLQSNLPILTSRESQKKIRNAINGKSSNFDMEISLEEGVRYFKGKLIPSTLGDGGSGVTLIMENITDQKLIEMRLKESTERYRELIENQGEGVGITDPKDVFIFANPAAENLMGVGPGRLVGRSVMDFLVGDHSKRVLNHNERRKKGKKDTYQIEILAEDGKHKTILLTATPRFDRSGDFIGSFGVFRDITQMKENESRISESEERYRLLYQFTSDAILILKGTGIIDCNDSTLKMFGYSEKKDMIGLEPQNLSPPLQLNGVPTELEIENKISEVLEKGFITFNWVHQRKDGDTFLAEVQLQSIKIGEESLLQARLMDITEKIKAKKELIRLSSAFHIATEAIAISDPDWKIVEVNDALAELFGSKNKEDFIGLHYIDLLEQDDKEEGKKMIQSILKEKSVKDIHFRIRREDGSLKELETNGSILIDNTGKPLGFLTVSRDVTARKRIMEELLLKDRILESIISLSDVMVREGNWKDKIKDGMGNLGRSIGVSRVYIFKNREEDMNILTTQILEWTAEGVESQMENPSLKDFPMNNDFQRWIGLLSNGEAVHGNVKELPKEERAILEPQCIFSIAVVPILLRGRFWGFMGFDDCRNEREWYSEEIKALKLAGSVIGAVASRHDII